MVASDIDDLIPDNIAAGKPIVQETIPEVVGVLGATGCLNTDVPEDFLVVSDHLKENRRKPISAFVVPG